MYGLRTHIVNFVLLLALIVARYWFHFNDEVMFSVTLTVYPVAMALMRVLTGRSVEHDEWIKERAALESYSQQPWSPNRFLPKAWMLLALLTLGACSWNPFQPSPGGTEFTMTQDGKIHYANTGRDVDAASGKVRFPNGAEGEFSVRGTSGSASTQQAVAAQAQVNMARIQAIQATIPKLTAADLMKLMAIMGGIPVIP